MGSVKGTKLSSAANLGQAIKEEKVTDFDTNEPRLDKNYPKANFAYVMTLAKPFWRNLEFRFNNTSLLNL